MESVIGRHLRLRPSQHRLEQHRAGWLGQTDRLLGVELDRRPGYHAVREEEPGDGGAGGDGGRAMQGDLVDVEISVERLGSQDARWLVYALGGQENLEVTISRLENYRLRIEGHRFWRLG